MNAPLSPNTQAILLLTAPFLVGHGRRASTAKPLTPSEYKHLARLLIANRREPADLLGESASAVLRECRPVLDEDRARRLLDRGFLLSQAVEHWASRATGVLADSLELSAMNRDNRELLMDGQLVLVSPNDPNARFNVGNAMQRNKLIYALADAALVVNSDLGKGGTWAGATEQLEKLHLVPVCVRSTGETNNGLVALRRKGALPWPNPEDAEALDLVLRPVAPVPAISQAQSEPLYRDHREIVKPGMVREASPGCLQDVDNTVPGGDGTALDPADVLFRSVRELTIRILDKPRKVEEVATGLGVTKRQAEEWLRRLVEEGVLEKSSKPAGYVVRQVGLFAAPVVSTGCRSPRSS
jgi:predicted Rossmann fold nucleotide-binding protein DprA/Smf involved in DNA uptake